MQKQESKSAGKAAKPGQKAGKGTTTAKGKSASAPEQARPGSTLPSIRAIAARYEGKPGMLLSILEAAQDADEFRHLSAETLEAVAEVTGESLSRVYSVATFYSYFNLSPQGKHTIVVCRGTACHTRGSLALLQESMAKLGVVDFREDEEPTFTTGDKMFTVRTVACFGQCALAPVVAVDGTIYSRITPARLCSIIDTIRKEKRR